MSKNRQRLLWEITSVEHSSTSYLFGTIHLSHELTDDKLNHPFFLLGRTEKLILEIDPVAVNTNRLKEFSLLNKELNLKSFFSERKFSRMRKNLVDFCDFDIDEAVEQYPFVLINLIHQKLIKTSGPFSMDMRLYHRAKSLNLEIGGLIPVEEEFEVIPGIDLESQSQQLYRLSRNLSSVQNKIEKMIFWYAQEKIHHLYRISKKQLGESRALLLYQRNHKMFEKAKSVLKSGKPVFIAVGAAHLSGEKGLLSLLRKEGFILKPFRRDNILLST